ncbi:MAG: nicotinamidase/pyrazinamidase [Planctomycetota bacterium]|jgi:nicotinamidase/pyrazinamidase
MKNRALILVDLQNDFMPGGALAVPDGDATVAIANELMASYDFVVATQDWHPEGHGSFAASHADRSPGEVIELHGVAQVLWPVHCVQGTPGASFHSSLDVAGIDAVVRKGEDLAIDSYGGFFDNGGERATGLTEILRDRGIIEVDLMGLATDYCVRFTALDAVREGFQARLLVEGCRGVELAPGDVAAALAEMAAVGVELRDPCDLRS